MNTQTQATLLLTAYFGKSTDVEFKPLTPTEWGRLALWLNNQKAKPENLILNSAKDVLSGWVDKTITLERIQALLDRSAALALAVERWERAGIWFATRADEDYPARLKEKLRTSSPPVFFCCGNKKLMNVGGIAVVGSRNATVEDISCSRYLGDEIARQRHAVISGGARGVDESVMLGSLAGGGRVVGILSDSLLRAATSSVYREYLMSNNLLLISPYGPESGFNAGNAMGRNKYLYCMSDAAVVVASDKNKGGTWTGAIENLKKDWVPLWVKRNQDKDSGVYALVENGANWLPDQEILVSALFDRSTIKHRLNNVEGQEKGSVSQVSLFDSEKPVANKKRTHRQ